MLKRMLIMLALVVVFIAAIAVWKVITIKAAIAQGAAFAPPPAAVTTAIARTQKWQPVLGAIGSLRAVNGVTVSTDLPGIVSEVAFESGAEVKKGDLLLKLDTRQEAAQLRSVEARRDLARINLDRQRDLVTKKAVAQSEYDAAATEFRQAEAAVEEARALVARKTIVAPFDGLLGIRQANLGQYLNVGSMIVALQSLDPIYVEFSLPQQHLGSIAVGKKLRLRAEGIEDAQFEGTITAIDSRVDESTRNIRIQGTVPNADRKLRPGMFVNVEVLLPEQEGVIAVPSSAINYAPYGDSVFIVKEGTTPQGKSAMIGQQQFVKTGPARGDLVSILSGVKEGDEVVTSGVFKLRSGEPVQVNNSVQPGSEPNPKPPET
jgi:membrane fusion protein (multidrug efflux system)